MTPPFQIGEVLTAQQVLAEIDAVASPEVAKTIRDGFAKSGFPQVVYNDLNIEPVTLYRRKGAPRLVPPDAEPEVEVDHRVALFMTQAEAVKDMFDGGPAAMRAITEAVDSLMSAAATQFDPTKVDEQSVANMLAETDPDVLDFATIREMEPALVPLAVYRSFKVIHNAALDYALMNNAQRFMMGYRGMTHRGP